MGLFKQNIFGEKTSVADKMQKLKQIQLARDKEKDTEEFVFEQKQKEKSPSKENSPGREKSSKEKQLSREKSIEKRWEKRSRSRSRDAGKSPERPKPISRDEKMAALKARFRERK